MTTVIYRPNAAGTTTNITSGGSTHWDQVNEVGDGAGIYTNSTSYQLDTYNFANPTETGTINSVKVYVKLYTDTSGTSYGKAAIRSGATDYYGSEESVTSSAATYSKTWTTDPATSAAWTWSGINSLEIGVSLKYASGSYVNCVKVYVEIDYTAAAGSSYAIALGV